MNFNEIVEKTMEVNEDKLPSVDDIVDKIVAKAGDKKLSIDAITKMIGTENEYVVDTVVARLEAKGIVAEKKEEK